MRRLFIAGALLIAACTAAPLGAGARGQAQGVPSRKDISKLILEAHQKRYLTGEGSPPFHLLATFRYTYGSVTKTGTYELLWSAPERFREEFRLGDDVGETDLASDGKLYVSRNKKFTPISLWQIRSLMFLPERPVWAKLEGETSVHSITAESLEVYTIELGTKPGANRVRLNFLAREILSEETIFGQGETATASHTDDYVDFGSARYPQHFLSTAKDMTVEINVVKLEQAGSFADVVFAPPENATVRDWCAEPEIAKPPLGHIFGDLFVVSDLEWTEKKVGAHYFLIAPDGSVETMARLSADGTESVGVLPKAEKEQARMPVRSCGGKPIEYEFVTRVMLLKP
jgi:hypothetical protein